MAHPVFCLFANSEQTSYFEIGEFCLFMMRSRPKLNVKWQVMQTGGQSGLQLSFFQSYHVQNLMHEFKHLNVSWT